MRLDYFSGSARAGARLFHAEIFPRASRQTPAGQPATGEPTGPAHSRADGPHFHWSTSARRNDRHHPAAGRAPCPLFNALAAVVSRNGAGGHRTGAGRRYFPSQPLAAFHRGSRHRSCHALPAGAQHKSSPVRQLFRLRRSPDCQHVAGASFTGGTRHRAHAPHQGNAPHDRQPRGRSLCRKRSGGQREGSR